MTGRAVKKVGPLTRLSETIVVNQIKKTVTYNLKNKQACRIILINLFTIVRHIFRQTASQRTMNSLKPKCMTFSLAKSRVKTIYACVNTGFFKTFLQKTKCLLFKFFCDISFISVFFNFLFQYFLI